MPQTVSADLNTGIIHRNLRKKGRKHHGDWQDEPPNFAKMEQTLWRAVIMQAMVDAANCNARPAFATYKFEAIRWLTSNSEDFLEVCRRACLDASYVRVRAKKALANPSLWKNDPGLSARYEERRAKREKRRINRRNEDIPQQTGCLIFNFA